MFLILFKVHYWFLKICFNIFFNFILRNFLNQILNFRSLCYSELDVWLISVPTWVIGLQLSFYSQWWLTCWFYTTVSYLSEISRNTLFGIFDWAIHDMVYPISEITWIGLLFFFQSLYGLGNLVEINFVRNWQSSNSKQRCS